MQYNYQNEQGKKLKPCKFTAENAILIIYHFDSDWSLVSFPPAFQVEFKLFEDIWIEMQITVNRIPNWIIQLTVTISSQS